MQRIGLIIVPGIIAIALFVGINSFDTLSNEAGAPTTGSSLGFNAYSEGINTILYDAQGNINYTLQAERQVHYNDDSTELEKPFIRLFQDGDTRWNIVAKSGRIPAAEKMKATQTTKNAVTPRCTIVTSAKSMAVAATQMPTLTPRATICRRRLTRGWANPVSTSP